MKRFESKAFELSILKGQTQEFTVKFRVFDEFWTYLGMGRGSMGLPDRIPFFEFRIGIIRPSVFSITEKWVKLY
ncbi:hypothetical protein GFS03_04635 [Sulfolobus sp. E5-1-F]|nr:hypothetical protein GFS03_04635 [Sulfolobus sp. E5-1-F]